jgi:non-specific serine/threonine protein kinase/serine/threonine-protein kinase
MGVVYCAWQEDLHRSVALKMILAGVYASPQELARFRTEAEAAARLQHAQIVQVHGLGEHDGRPYIALEYVDGGSLARELDGTPWPAARAARLVETLARAMHHAHRQGIMHRDLKPANVLLTGDGTPKISDFGLAKVLVRGGPSLTETGAVMGTPSYMAPEQAAGKTHEVGPAIDVYALGAILYELLTGRPPFKAATNLETLQQVVHEEPVPPRRLQPKLPRDLETICLKCLHKEPVRRYADAESLAEDLRRFQAGEPIAARPVGVVERGLKWTRRRPAAAALMALALLVLVGGVTAVLWYADRERGRADQERALRREAEDQREQAQAVLGFFQERVLAAARPQGEERGLGKDATIRQALDAAEPEIGLALAGQPAVEATIRNTLGMSYYFLGEPAPAIQQFERALALRRQLLGQDHADTLRSLSNLASAYRQAGRLAEALPLYKEGLERDKAQLGPDHPETLDNMSNLALAYKDAGRWTEALPLLEQVLKKRQAQTGPDDPATLRSMDNLAGAYLVADRLDEALSMFEEVLKKRKVQLGLAHPETLRSMNNLAGTYQKAGRPADALPLLEQALKGREAQLGPDHPDTLLSMHNLAQLYRKVDRPAGALRLVEEAFKRSKAKLRPDHPLTLTFMTSLAMMYQEAGRGTEALPLLEEALKGRKAQLGPDHPHTLQSLRNLAVAYLDGSQPDRGLALVYDFLSAQRRQQGADPLRLADVLVAVGRDFLKHAHHAEAERVLREGVTIRESKLPDDWMTFDGKSLLGGSLLGQHRYAEAEPLLVQGYEGMKTREHTIPPAGKVRLTEALERLVNLYEAWGQKEKAEAWRKRRDAAP